MSELESLLLKALKAAVAEHPLPKQAWLDVIAKAEHDCKDPDQDPCEECCEHCDVDFPTCLDCGKDMTEDFMARAENAWDAARGH